MKVVEMKTDVELLVTCVRLSDHGWCKSPT